MSIAAPCIFALRDGWLALSCFSRRRVVMYLAISSDVKLAGTMKTLVVSNKFLKWRTSPIVTGDSV